MARTPRVVITGMGAVSPLGLDVPALWSGVKEARSGVGPITRFDAADFETRIAAEVKDFDPTQYMDRKDARRADRVIQFAMAAAAEALRSAEFEITAANGDRVGVLIGSGIGGIGTISEAHHALAARGPGRVRPRRSGRFPRYRACSRQGSLRRGGRRRAPANAPSWSRRAAE